MENIGLVFLQSFCFFFFFFFFFFLLSTDLERENGFFLAVFWPILVKHNISKIEWSNQEYMCFRNILHWLRCGKKMNFPFHSSLFFFFFVKGAMWHFLGFLSYSRVNSESKIWHCWIFSALSLLAFFLTRFGNTEMFTISMLR